MLRRIYNILFYVGWSFKISTPNFLRTVIKPGDEMRINFRVLNNGLRQGVVYAIILIADPYDHRKFVFNSHRDLSQAEKQRLRLTVIRRGESEDYSYIWKTPSNLNMGILDIEIQLWNPPKLFRPRSNLFRFRHHRFSETRWLGYIEVVHLDQSGQNDQDRRVINIARPRVFISYSWDSDTHQKWVIELARELFRNGIEVVVDSLNIVPGEEITMFIERSISECDVLLLICTSNYTDKANNRLGGVGMETVISSATFMAAKESKKFIPIVRDNVKSSFEKLPKYLGSTLYIDMSTNSWRAEPLQRLISAIRLTK